MMTLSNKSKSLSQRVIHGITLIFLFFTFTGGVYRHDVAIEKYLALGKEEQFNCVGQVLWLDGELWKAGGSFVLIDSVTVLSAAHVFIGQLTKDTVVNIQGQKFKTHIVKGIYKKNEHDFQFLLMNKLVKPKRITLHPNYISQKNCDIAIIKLETPIRGLKTIPLYLGNDELGDTVTGVGFGVSGPANRPELVGRYNLKIAGRNIIDSVGGTFANGQSSMLYADFDAPDERNNCNKMGSSEPLELEYCTGGGDSGGPIFSYKGGNMYLVGITSGGGVTPSTLLKNGYYCGVSAWTRVSSFINWVKENK